VYVSAANDGQEFKPGRAHALKRQIERLIRVEVWESAGIYKVTQPFVSSAFSPRSLEPCQADNTYHSSLIGHQPSFECARANP
jgi:hypothetical protein